MPHELVFTHPSPKLRHNRLALDIKPDQIVWSYGLNTANYPTYGGEVVQILSCYIEDMNITGTTRSYRKLEQIYEFFIDYIQLATQGKKGAGSGAFNPTPIEMNYPERGWNFKIHPTNLPGFRYGRDVVAPQWNIVAAVADSHQNFVSHVMTKAQMDMVSSDGDIKLFGRVTGAIGYKTDDPFRTPFVGKTKDTIASLNKELGDSFSHLLPAWLQGDFGDLSAEYSHPAIGSTSLGSGNTGTQKTANQLKNNGKQP